MCDCERDRETERETGARQKERDRDCQPVSLEYPPAPPPPSQNRSSDKVPIRAPVCVSYPAMPCVRQNTWGQKGLQPPFSSKPGQSKNWTNAEFHAVQHRLISTRRKAYNQPASQPVSQPQNRPTIHPVKSANQRTLPTNQPTNRPADQLRLKFTTDSEVPCN